MRPKVSIKCTNLVVVVQKLLAVKSLETSQDTFTDSSNTDSPNDFVLKIVFILGDSSDVPFTSLDLLVGRNEVADEGEDCHDNICGSVSSCRQKPSAQVILRSATETTLDPVTSATVIPPFVLFATLRSTWSDPIPAVTASFSFLALARRSAVK